MAISDSLFKTMKDEILSGKLKRGAKLTEKLICTEHGVSRTPVRQALQKLEMEGLAKSIPNRGFFVIGLSSKDYEDLFTLRRIYEAQALTWAIERATKEEREQIEELFEFMEFYTMKKDVAKMLTINMNFHKSIYQASHNKMLENLLSSYQDMLKHVEIKHQDYDDYLDRVLSEHREIYIAFKNKDIEAGVKAINSHIDNSLNRFKLANIE